MKQSWSWIVNRVAEYPSLKRYMKDLLSLQTASGGLRLGVCLLSALILSLLPGNANSALFPPPDVLKIPIVSVHAVRAETHEPFCNPEVCDAALPPPAVVAFTREGGDLQQSLMVWVSWGGSAKNGEDYLPLSDVISFSPGQSTVELWVESRFDQLAEGDESVEVGLLPDPSLGPIERYLINPALSVAKLVIHDSTPSVLRLEIREPKEGQHFLAGEPIFLSAQVLPLPADDRNWVIEFFEGEHRLRTGNGWWTDAIGGAHTIHAKAYHPAGIPGQDVLVSPAITITVGEGPAWPVVRLEALNYRTTEPCPVCLVAPGVVQVSRNGDLSRDLKVYLSIDGSATPGKDYAVIPLSVVIPAGRDATVVRVLPNRDDVVEAPEVVRFSIALPEMANRGYVAHAFADQALVAIYDEFLGRAPEASLEFLDPSEGTEFAQGRIIPLTVAGAWTRGELDRPIHFFANSQLIGTVVPPQVLRPTLEGLPSQHTLWWTNPPPGRYTLQARTDLGGDLKVLTSEIHITVGRPAIEPVVTIEATSRIAEETSNPLRRLPLRGEFTIRRTGSLALPLSVFVHYSGSAVPGVDFPPLPFLVTLPSGESSATLEVVPKLDDVPEGLETLVATLSQCPPDTDPPMGIPCYGGYEIDPLRSRARIFIRDDGLTQSSIVITTPKTGQTFEEGVPIEVQAVAVDLEGAMTRALLFDGETQIGESTILFVRPPDPGDPIQHSFVWRGASPGKHVLTVRSVDASEQKVQSPDVTIEVGGLPGVPKVTVTTWDAFGVEPSAGKELDVVAFRVRRTGAIDADLSVRVSFHGVAENGVDYERLVERVVIPHGRRSVLVTVTPIADRRREPRETVAIKLEPSLTDQYPPPYEVGAPGQATAILSDAPWVPRPGHAECAWLPDGLAQLCFAAETGLSYRAEASVDFINWEPIFHGVPVNGVLYVVDDRAAGFARRFYRIVPESAEPED